MADDLHRDYNKEGSILNKQEKVPKTLLLASETDVNLDALYKKTNNLDEIYQFNNGSVIYIGNYTAASNIQILHKFKIKYIINCTDTESLPNEFENKNTWYNIKYYRFDIYDAYKCYRVNRKDSNELYNKVDGLFKFIDDALKENGSILIHCLAGAHRAGATSVITLVNYARFEVEYAIKYIKSKRPIVDPPFIDYLKKLEEVINIKNNNPTTFNYK